MFPHSLSPQTPLSFPSDLQVLEYINNICMMVPVYLFKVKEYLSPPPQIPRFWIILIHVIPV